MKKRLLSIIAIILCFCTVFVFAACGKKDSNEDMNPNGDASESDTASLEGSESDGTKESGKTDDPDGVKDADAATAEAIFTQMKADYNATLGYTGAYAVNTAIKAEQSRTEKNGDVTDSTKDSSDMTIVSTADPAATKYSTAITTKSQAEGEEASTGSQSVKVFADNGKTYKYASENGEGVTQLLSSKGLTSAKNEMLLKNIFAEAFASCLGDPFSASNAANLKTVTNKVLNEVKANTASLYKSGAFGITYNKADCTATANILINKVDGANVLKRTISYSISLEWNGGTRKENATIESLLKTKDGKILSFETTLTTSAVEEAIAGGTVQENGSSNTKYDFKYAFSSSDYDKITATVPSDVLTMPDFFEAPVTLVIGGNEMPVTVLGVAAAETPISSILQNYLEMALSGKTTTWYKDSSYSTEFDFSTITSADSLKGLKLYAKGVDLDANESIAIAYGTKTANISADYKTVFGNIPTSETIDTYATTFTGLASDNTEQNIRKVAIYEPNPGYTPTITLNGSALNLSDTTEEPTGELCWEMQVEIGKIYYVKHTYKIENSYFTLNSFFMG